MRRNYLDADDLLTRWGIWRSQGTKILSVKTRTIFSSLPAKRVIYHAVCDICHGYSVEYCQQCRGKGKVQRTYDACDPRLINSTDNRNSKFGEGWSQPPEYKRIDALILGMPCSIGACLTGQYVYYPGRYQHQRRIAWINERLESANLSKIDTDQEFRKLLRHGKQIVSQVFSLPVSQFSECRRRGAHITNNKRATAKSDAVVIKMPERETLHLPKTRVSV